MAVLLPGAAPPGAMTPRHNAPRGTGLPMKGAIVWPGLQHHGPKRDGIRLPWNTKGSFIQAAPVHVDLPLQKPSEWGWRRGRGLSTSHQPPGLAGPGGPILAPGGGRPLTVPRDPKCLSTVATLSFQRPPKTSCDGQNRSSPSLTIPPTRRASLTERLTPLGNRLLGPCWEDGEDDGRSPKG